MTSISNVEIRVLMVSLSYALFIQDGYVRLHWEKNFPFFLIPNVIFSELLCVYKSTVNGEKTMTCLCACSDYITY